MATVKNAPAAPVKSPFTGEHGFSVVAQIGFVEFSSRGEHTPMEAAMALIARHNREGTYRFPHEDGGEWVINMDHDTLQSAAENTIRMGQ